MSFDAMYDGFNEAEESHGFEAEPLPSGWYPLVVESCFEPELSRNGAPQVRLQVKVTEGDCVDKRAFVSITMGPARIDKDGAERTEEELVKTSKTIQSQMKGLLQALGVQTGQPVGDTDLQKVCSFFGVSQWASRQFMGYIRLMKGNAQYPNPSNRLNAYRNIDDEEKGIGAWRAGQGGANGGGAAQAESI